MSESPGLILIAPLFFLLTILPVLEALAGASVEREDPSWTKSTALPRPLCRPGPFSQFRQARGAEARLQGRGVSPRYWASVRSSCFVHRSKTCWRGWLQGWVWPEYVALGVRVGWFGRKLRGYRSEALEYHLKTRHLKLPPQPLPERLRDTPREDPSHRVEIFFILVFISCFAFQQFPLFVSHKSSFFFRPLSSQLSLYSFGCFLDIALAAPKPLRAYLTYTQGCGGEGPPIIFGGL